MPTSNTVIQTLRNNNINLKRISELDTIDLNDNENIQNSYLLLSNDNTKKNYKFKVNKFIQTLVGISENEIIKEIKEEILGKNNDDYTKSRIDKLEEEINNIKNNGGESGGGNTPDSPDSPNPPTPPTPPTPSITYHFWFSDDDNLSKIIENDRIKEDAVVYSINDSKSYPFEKNKTYIPYYLIQEKFGVEYDYEVNQNLYMIIPENSISIEYGILSFSDNSPLTTSGFVLSSNEFYNNTKYYFDGAYYRIIVVVNKFGDGLRLKR